MQLRLQPKQGRLYDLLTATGPHVATTIGFGGAKGGGKSDGTRQCALLLAFELAEKYPGITITIMRRVSDDLRKNHISPLFRSFPELRNRYREADKELSLNNGARIIFAHAETKGDVERKFLGGYESTFIFVDEAQQFEEEELNWIKAACRWTGAEGIPVGLCKLVLLFNPGGKSAEYLRRIFWTKQYRGKEEPESYAFMHVFGWDNYEWFRGQVPIDEPDFYQLDSDQRFQLFITQTSEGRKYDAFPDSIRAGYLLGDFDHFENQYFAGAWDETKCVLKPSQVNELIQPWWTRWMGQDWGFGDHAAHYWFASGKVKPSDWMRHFGGKTEYAMDIVIAYREHVISNRAEADLATDIVAMTEAWERKQIQRFFLSQDAFGQRARQGGNTVGETFTKVLTRYQMPSPETADQNRVMGWRFMYNCLRQANLVGTNISEERSKQGPAFFISAECPQAIAGIPMAIRAEDDVDDVERVAGAIWEDVTDGLRYGLHTMLNPKTKAPMDVRAREVYDSIQGDTPENLMTARAMAMAKFKHEEGVIRRVQRMPRWR